jgi:hypothetical protein
MARHMRMFSSLTLATVASMAGGAAPATGADEIRFSVADVFAELNDTDGDLGFHAFIDGDAWKKLVIEDPDGRQILLVRPVRNSAQQGLNELSFESAEPPFDELSPEEFFDRFPEGRYEVIGRTIDGDKMRSRDRFTHVMPAPPDNLQVSGKSAPSDCDREGPVTVNENEPITISFDEVQESHPDLGAFDPDIEIVGYQIAVEREEPTALFFSVDLPPSDTKVRVPPQFIALGREFKFEVLAREASGNQTAVESCFRVK